jgi:type IX secretion system PorP/SprF family membrane protein
MNYCKANSKINKAKDSLYLLPSSFCLIPYPLSLLPCNIKKLILTLGILSTSLFCNAQQMPLYSQYGMYNPAIAGVDGYTTISVTSRDEWIGFDNSPRTNVLSAQGRLLRRNYQIKNNPLFKGKSLSKRSGRVGLGALVFNDKNGVITRTGGQLTYAYHIFINNTQVSFGLAASTFQFKIAQDELKFRDQEPLLNDAFSNKVLVPDVTFGFHVLNPASYYGFSVANLFQSRINIGSKKNYDYRLYRHYFLMAGKSFLDENIFSFEPSILIKGTEKMIFQADIQMRAYYNKDYFLGLTYRTGSAIGTMIGLKWNRLYLTYVFDYTLSKLQRHTFGSHEVCLALKLGDNVRRYRWLIRY